MTEEGSTIVQFNMFAAEESRWNKQSIYRIPPNIKSLNKTRAYEPHMVSIGPYHYGKLDFPTMEDHKLRALHHFSGTSGITFDRLCQELYPDVKDFKDAYNQLDDGTWENDNEFLQLMVRDGCFVSELLGISAATQTWGNGYPKNDPIFSKHGWLNIVPYLKRDMLMLENQIPMPVLQKLYAINPPKDRKPLIKRILCFFGLRPQGKLENCLHILDLYRESLISEPNRKDSSNSEETGAHQIEYNDKIIRSATELNDAGITITRSKTNSLRDISFEKGLFSGHLRLPLIVVDDAFESLYLNLIAYERFHVSAQENAVTAYLILMDSIIDSVQDVGLLHSSSVIQNALSSDKKLAKLFNSLCTDSTLDPKSKLGEIHGKVSKFCENKWPKWRAYCCHHYCTNPLVAITVIAAILIFAMTILQSGYNVMDHIKAPPPK